MIFLICRGGQYVYCPDGTASPLTGRTYQKSGEYDVDGDMLVWHSGRDTINTVVKYLRVAHIVGAIIPIVWTEMALRRNFDDDGNPMIPR